jgi:hypothetical protein
VSEIVTFASLIVSNIALIHASAAISLLGVARSLSIDNSSFASIGMGTTGGAIFLNVT